MTIKDIKQISQYPPPEWFYKRLLVICGALFGVFLTICGVMLQEYQSHIEETFRRQADFNQVTIQNQNEIENIKSNYATQSWVLQKFEQLEK